MSYAVLVVEDDLAQRELIERMLKDSEYTFYSNNHHEPVPTNQVRERDYGWYRQFDKTNKRNKFTSK